MKGLIYIDHSQESKFKSLDLTPYWRGTVKNSAIFNIEGTNNYVKLCGQFDSRTAAYIFNDTQVVVLVNGYFDVFCINFNEYLIENHKISWYQVFKFIDYIVVAGLGELIVFKFDEFARIEFNQNFKLNRIDLENNTLILIDNDEKFIEFYLDDPDIKSKFSSNWLV